MDDRTYRIKRHMLSNSCNIGTSDLPDMYAQSPRAAQLICNITPDKLKSAPARNLRTKITSIFIGKLTKIDCGL